jgi:hypothetical protein
VKRLFPLSVIAVALAVAASGWLATGAQARVTVTVFKPGTQQFYESRMKMCNGNVKGLYRTQQDGVVYPYGWCLSNVANKPWK